MGNISDVGKRHIFINTILLLNLVGQYCNIPRHGHLCLLCHVKYICLVIFRSLCIRLVQTVAGNSLASSGLLLSPPTSRDRLDDDSIERTTVLYVLSS